MPGRFELDQLVAATAALQAGDPNAAAQAIYNMLLESPEGENAAAEILHHIERNS